MKRFGSTSTLILPAAALVALAWGALARVMGDGVAAHRIWMAGLLVIGGPLIARALRDARHGRFATDLVAALSIATAIVLGEPIAGLVIVLMQSGGEALERYAEGRASAALVALEAAAPRIAHRMVEERVQDVAASDVAVGDVLLIRPGELIPCDGVVISGSSDLDTSQLTGEAMPVDAHAGVVVLSGACNGAGALRMRATARAGESQYARIVQLVRSAQASKAPLQRLADHYAVWFTPVTLLACAATFAFSHDWTRVLAVLVVATPCPLILATPIAIIGGVNLAARHHIIVRHGAALERLAAATTAVFDKTGTITVGRPMIRAVHVTARQTPSRVLRYAGAVEQGSSHQLARVIADTAASYGDLPQAHEHVESPGRGVVGTVDGHEVRVGARSYVVPACRRDPAALATLEAGEMGLRAYVGIDGELAGTIEYADELRSDAPSLLARLRESGIKRVLLLSGDHADNARSVAERLGIDEVHGDLLPTDKAAMVHQLRAAGAVVMMAGDGTNDAPALSSADVGIALASHGGGITTEAADVVVLIDSLTSVAEAREVGQRTVRIAKQSILAGLGLSGAAMVVAATGHIPPTVGALLQEVIDVAVILNALRVGGGALASRSPTISGQGKSDKKSSNSALAKGVSRTERLIGNR
jgi:heavy metal translocating P-type ATPase